MPYASPFRPKRLLSVLAFCGSTCLVPLVPHAAEQASEQSALQTQGDYLTLAAMLIKDGHFTRAMNTLARISPEALAELEIEEQIRFHTLKGLTALNLGQHLQSIDSFNQAIQLGQKEPVVLIYLAQAHFALKQYKPTLTAIHKAGSAVDRYPALYEIQAQCHWLLKQKEQAWQTLHTARKQFPQDYRFLRRQVFYAVDMGLFQDAAKLGKEYLVKSDAQVDDYLAIGNALRLSREFEGAMNILERARLQFPDQANVAKVLAHTYLDQGMPGAAASILEDAANFDPGLISESAELYRRAGRLYRALALNERIHDQKVKLKQRVAILIGLKDYETVSHMEAALHRANLLQDQPIRYALAYAQFATGQYQKAEQYLGKLSDPELFKKAIELRRAMQECRAEPGRCA